MNRSDRQIFEKEALKYIDNLYFFALKISKEKDDAENLVQETYLKAFKFSNSFKLGTNMKAWLFKILNNNFFSMKKYEKKIPLPQNDSIIEKKASEYSIFQEKELSSAYDSELIMMKSIMDEQLEASFNSLTEENRKLLFLIDIEEMSYEEVASIINIPVGTVKSRVFRARNKLKNNFIKRKRIEERNLLNESV